MSTRKKIIIGAAVIFLLLLLSGGNKKSNTPAPEVANVPKNVVLPASTDTRSFLMGFTSWPPSFDAGDIKKAYAFMGANGDIFAMHQSAGVPWVDAFAGKPSARLEGRDWKFVRDNKPKGSKMYLALTPDTDRDGLALLVNDKGDNEPLPSDWKGLAFDDPKVEKAYLNYVIWSIGFWKPDYLAIGIESNVLAQKHPDKWAAYLKLNHYVYQEVKKQYPNLPVFATIQYEYLKGLTEETKGKTADQERILNELLPTCDMVVLSTYPYTAGVWDVPSDYFDLASSYGKPVGVGESGYSSVPFSIRGFPFQVSSVRQENYFSALLGAASRNHYRFIINYVAFDYTKLLESFPDSAKELGSLWVSTGLADGNGNTKPAFNVWSAYFKLKYQ